MTRHAWTAFATTRLVLAGIGSIVLTVFPPHPVESWQGIVFPHNTWIDGWVRWDSMWYEALVNDQPRFLPSGHSTANFFPLYSWVSWLVSIPIRVMLDHERAFYVGGLIVSAVSLLLALIAVERLATALAGADVAGRAVWLIAVFPFSFFLTAVYADALYFCLAAWSLTFASERKWNAACALAALAAMTRIPGLALYPAILLEYLRRHDFDLRSLRRFVPPLAVLTAGAIAILLYFQWRYDNPLAFLEARQQGWNRASGFVALRRDFTYFMDGSFAACGAGLASCVRDFDPTRQLLGYWYIALVPFSLGVTVHAARTLGAGLTAWTVLSVLMALVNGLDGTGRFTSVLFPVFIGLAMLLRSRAAFLAVCAGFVPFLLLFFAQFARWKQVL